MIVHFVARLLVCIIVCGVSLTVTVPDVSAETKILSKDTKLHPQGWGVGDSIQFKKNTSISLNEQEEVVSGTIDKDTLLSPRGWNRVINDYYYTTVHTDFGPYYHHFYYHPFFNNDYAVSIPGYGHLLYKGGTEVIFSEQGDVISGTIANKATVRLVDEKYGFVTFKSDTILMFFNSGAVISGTLDEDTYLRPVGWQKLLKGDNSAGFIKFSKGKTVTFNEKGELTSGTVKEDVVLLAEDGTHKGFSAGSAVEFNEIGVAKIKVNFEQGMH